MKKLLLVSVISILGSLTALAQIPANALTADPTAQSVNLLGGGSIINQTGVLQYWYGNNSPSFPGPGTDGLVPINSLFITIGFPIQYGLQPGLVPVVADFVVLGYTAGP